jgi:predicted RNA binding protein YcfA (HicA-like mRNA interferase family)
MPATVKDVLRALRDAGWEVVSIRGDHRKLRHIETGRTTVVAGNLSDTIAPGTLAAIRRQTGLTRKELW